MNIVIQIALIFLINAPITCRAMKAEDTEKPKMIITPEMIAAHEDTFKKFIKELEEEKWPKLQQLPDPDSWLGGAVVGLINFVTTSFTRYGEVRPKETKKFLGRVFETPHAGAEYEIPLVLQQGVSTLKGKDSEFLSYINGVLNRLTEKDLKNRDLGCLAKAMEEEKKNYPDMPGSRNMDKKEEVPDSVFAPFAAAQLFTTCCVEERLLLPKKNKDSKHRPHRSNKHRSIEA